jgi:hypothetical protein
MRKYKFIRVNPAIRWYLWDLSSKQNNVFASPNDVLKSVLGMDSKHTVDEEKDKKIRIDIKVYDKLMKKAAQYGKNNIKPLDVLVRRILLEQEIGDKTMFPKPATRPTRPPTK